MDFGAAFALLMQGRKVTRQGWPGGSWLELRPGTGDEAAHPVVAWADGRPSHAYQHPVADLWHSADWVLADLPERRDG